MFFLLSFLEGVCFMLLRLKNMIYDLSNQFAF